MTKADAIRWEDYLHEPSDGFGVAGWGPPLRLSRR